MADAAAPAPKIKKLPFKPTALRKAAPEPTPEDGSKKSDDDDGLALFRRSKEMAPIVARDRERRMQKNKRNKEVEGQRRSSGAEKRRVEEDDEEHSKLIEAQLGDDCDRAEASFRTDRSVTVKGDSFKYILVFPQRHRPG